MTKIELADLQSPMTYSEYVAQIQDLLQAGEENSLSYDESQLEFTALNQKRMARWDRRFAKMGFSRPSNLNVSSMTWLVITEGWCGDAAHIIPVIKQLSDDLGIERLLFINRDRNLDIMDQFLTNGGRSIPVMIVLSEQGEVLGNWGPRPMELQNYFMGQKSKPDFNYPEVQIGLQGWYNKDKGQTTAAEIIQMMHTLVS